MYIEGDGNHEITNCAFTRSKADIYGGHVLVRRAERLIVYNSSFVDGSAGSGGGAIAVEDTNALLIDSSSFEGNGGGLGGAIFMTNADGIEAILSITNSTFIRNFAEFGGAFLASALGSRFDSSSVSMRSEFQISDRSVTATSS